MLVLIETPAGYAIFKVTDKSKLKNPDDLMKEFATPESANNMVQLTAFSKFADTEHAVKAASALCEGTLDKGLKKFLKATLGEDPKDKLAVADIKLGNLIKEKMGIKCVFDDTVLELMRGIRSQLIALLPGISKHDQHAMTLGLSHSLSRYKLKFSPDKVDTMIIQAIALLDELDKELNTYAMRVREWYGWHFPEMGKLIADNIQYAKTVKKMGIRTHAKTMDLSDILAEEVESDVKEAAEVSMGTEVAEEDINSIIELADQVISIAEYRTQLFDYLKNRMEAIAPNTTVMVGALVGARLIAHAGSLMNLSKHPASTVQILGAEKALFRALKTKHETPKYGLIYHASLVGQAQPKLKGKISRVLAAKTALSIRMDALGETDGVTIGLDAKEKVEARLRQLEGGKVKTLSGTAKGKAKEEKYVKPTNTPAYNDAADTAMTTTTASDEETEKEKKKKKKKEKKAAEEAAAAAAAAAAETPAADDDSEKKKKKKKRKAEEAEVVEEPEAKKAKTDENGEKKKKKKKQAAEESD